MKKNISIIFLFLFHCIVLDAQTVNEKYSRLISYGNFQKQIIDEVQSHINAEQAERFSYKSSAQQKQKLDSAIYKNIFLRNMLLGGEVLYGDSVGNYVNKVAGELLKNDPELLKQFHFYALRSSNVNIFNLDDGFIFVNTGLIAQLEDEAQLAFILAHEIAHVKKKYPVIIDMKTNLELLNRNQYAFENMFASLKKEYSKEEEIDADAEAYEMMKRSGYSLKSINEALDLFQYSYLPFDDKVFDHAFFENDDYKLSDSVILKKISPIGTLEGNSELTEEENLVIRERRGLAGSFDLKDDGKRKFILPKTSFTNAREYSRFALCSDYLASRDYINAIYAAYILLKKYPESTYLQSVVSKALYAITISKTNYRNPRPDYINVPYAYQPESFENTIDLRPELMEGNSQPLYYLFNNIQAPELNVLSVSYVWKAYKQTGNKLLKPVIDSLFKELFVANNMKRSDFSELNKEQLKTQDSINSISENKEQNKYATIKALQTKDANSTKNKIKFAFVTFFKDKEFSEMFDRNLNASKRKSDLKTVKADLSLKKESIPKVLIVDPYFSYYPTKVDNFKKDIEKAEFQRGKYISMISAEMKKNKIEYQLIDDEDSLQTDIAAYNDRSSLHRWIIEREKNGSNPDALVLSVEDCQEIATKYGTPYIVLCGIKTIDEIKGQKSIHVFKVYNILSGDLVQFDVKVSNFIVNAQDMSMVIAYCVKELANKSAGK
ncbi:MAG: M48 family metallopeptidase [Bacteroidia bacterium]